MCYEYIKFDKGRSKYMKRDLSEYKSNLTLQLCLNMILLIVLSILTVVDFIYGSVIFGIFGLLFIGYSLSAIYLVCKHLLGIKRYEQ